MSDEGTIEQVLAHRIGLDPASVGGGLLSRALLARMSALGLNDRAAYGRLLRESEAEQEALIEEVVIPESWFFRDERPFGLFREYVQSQWLAQPSRSPLRVLSIPCASGEEPYSLAIALLDLGLPPARWSIDAVDISARSLERAALGVFGEGAFRGIDPAVLTRYFEPRGHKFSLNATVRSQVRFLRGNLLDPSLLRDELPYDVIFCRNLLIYLDPVARRSALDTIDRLLGPTGLVFLGHAERVETGEARFEPAGEAGCFAYRRSSPPPPIQQPVAITTVRARPAKAAPPPAHQRRANQPSNSAVVKESRMERPRGTLNRLDSSKVAGGDASSSLLSEAAALANQGRQEEAALLCERHLRELGPSAEALFLLGMIYQAAGDSRKAEAALMKAVYLDPRHDAALLALALHAQRRGDQAAAESFRRRAERANRRNENP